MKKNEKLQAIAEVAIFAAIGYVLDLIAGSYSSFFANGGSIGIALICVVVISYRRGMGYGAITGLLMGLLDLMDGFYAISDTWYNVFFQLGFDYIFAYTVVCLSAVLVPLTKKELTKPAFAGILAGATVIGGLAKFLSHFLSGVFFWPEYLDQAVGGRMAYSFAYNGGYMFPSIVVSALVVFLIALKAPQLFKKTDFVEVEAVTVEKKVSVPSIITSLVGTGILTYGIIYFVETMSMTGEYEYDYDGSGAMFKENDFVEAVLGHGALAVLLILLGLVVLAVGIYSLVKYLKGTKPVFAVYTVSLYLGLSMTAFVMLSYILTYCYKVFVAGKDPVAKGYDPTWPYAVVLIVTVVAIVAVALVSRRIKSKQVLAE